MNENHDENGRFAEGSSSAYKATKDARALSRDPSASHADKAAAHSAAGSKHEAMADKYAAAEQSQLKPATNERGIPKPNQFVATSASEDSRQKARDHMKNAKAHYGMAEKHAKEGIAHIQSKLVQFETARVANN